jgi:hypothetical protein
MNAKPFYSTENYNKFIHNYTNFVAGLKHVRILLLMQKCMRYFTCNQAGSQHQTENVEKRNFHLFLKERTMHVKTKKDHKHNM